MCSLRCLFILSPNGDIIISKRFPTVEKRAQLLQQSNDALVTVPSDEEFSLAVRRSLVVVGGSRLQSYTSLSLSISLHRSRDI